MKFIKQKLFLLSILLISGCSTLDSLRFWQNDEVDPDEPKELSSFASQENIKVLWRNSYNGENEIKQTGLLPYIGKTTKNKPKSNYTKDE